MLTRAAFLPCVLILASTLASQVAPGISRTEKPSKILGLTGGLFRSVGGRQVQQVAIFRLPGNQPGQWTCCLTVLGLSTTYGGNGSSAGVVMGVLDLNKNTFTPSTQANTLNTSGTDFGLMLGGKLGQYAVLDTPSGVHFAQRANFSVAFPAAKRVTGLPSGYIDPAVGFLNGKLMLFYNLRPNIMMDEFIITGAGAPRVKGAPTIVIQPVQAGGITHSFTPITGPDGDVEGAWLSERVGSQSNMYFADDLDPKTPQVLTNSHNGWQNNGGIAGGLLMWADSDSAPVGPYQAVMDAEAAWLLGDNVLIGGTADIFGAAFNNTKNPLVPVVTILFLSGGLLTTPFSVPTFNGRFGLDLTTLIPAFAVMTHTDASQEAKLSFTVPNDPTLKNLKLFLQGLSIQPTKNIKTFTNTARLNIF